MACALGACGRIGFESVGAGGDDVAMTDASPDDGAMMTGDGEMMGVWTVFAPAPPTTADLYTVWAFSPNDIWIGGIGGVVYEFNGTSWAARSGPTQDVYMLWGLSANDLWEVGRLCEVRRWNGAAWSPFVVPGCTNASFYAVNGISATDVWLVGVGGTIEHWVSGTFTTMPQANNIDFWAVWPVSATEAYIVGTRGTILHWNGIALFDESIANNVIVSAVWGTLGGDVWIVGTGGLIYRKPPGGAWTQVTSPTTTFLYWVFGTSANNVWAVGDFGVTLHFDGTSWKTVTVAATTSLRAIARVPGGGLRMVGHAGTILRNP